MRNVEELCDDVVMINDGRIVLNGPVNEIENSFGLTRIFVRTDKSAAELSALPGVKDVISQNNGMKLLILEDENMVRIFLTNFRMVNIFKLLTRNHQL